MKIVAAIIVLFLLVPVALPQAQMTRSALASQLTSDLENFRAKSLIPGFAVAVVDGRGVLYSKGFGNADVNTKAPYSPKTINWIASVSKTFIALAIIKLVEEKKLSLDEPINSILPYKIVNPHFPDKPITIRHLVTHTSSIVDSFEPYSVGEADVVLDDPNDATVVPDYVKPNVEWHRMSRKISLDENIRKFTQPSGKWYSDETFLKSAPGTTFQYTNLGASIAARIVEVRSGMSFEDFTARYIFRPLKMKNTAWNFDKLDRKLVSRIYVHNAEKDPTGVAEYPQYYMTNFPVSGLKTNIEDLARYLVDMISGLNGSGKLLKKKGYEKLFELQLTPKNFPDLNRESITDGSNSAIFWNFSKAGAFSHLGGNIGVYSFVRFDPATKIGSLAICNLRDNSFGDVYDLLAEYEKRFAAAR